MYGKNEFFGDFIRAYGYLGPANFRFGQIAGSAARYIDLCYKVYMNAATNALASLVIGRIVKRDGQARPINLEQIGRGLDDIERTNFGRTNSGSAGSVLSADEWSVPMNDAWLLGGVHAYLDFYVASPRTAQNIVDPQFGATVTGRELLGLTTFGYTIHPNTSLGEVYVCTDKGRAAGATFVAYERAFQAARGSGGFQELVASS